MCEQKLYPRHDFHSGAKAIRHSVNIALHYNCITFGGSLCTTRSTSGISSPLAATSVATKQRTFPSRKLCRVNKICTREPIEQLISVELFASCVPPLAQFPPLSRVRSCSFQRREEVYSQVAQKSIPLVSSHHAHIIIAKTRSYYRLKNEIYYIHS